MQVTVAELVRGKWAVPENPIMRARQPVAVTVDGLNELVAGKWAVPENPLMRGLTESRMGHGCSASLGCPGALSGYGRPGLFGVAQAAAAAVAPTSSGTLLGLSTKTWLLLGAGAAALYMFSAKSRAKAARA
jgi:hypothetical protein